MPTLKSLIREYNIRLELGGDAPYNETFPESNGYMVTLKMGRKQLTVPFYQGYGINHDPEVEDVLDCLLSDASSIDSSRDIMEWAYDLGYIDAMKEDYKPYGRKGPKVTMDSIRKTYEACVRIQKRLKGFLGNHYEEFMYSER